MENYHPEIMKLPTVSIDTTYSVEENRTVVGRSSTFFVVPTQMVINGERGLWKHCPSLVNWDLLQCIEDIVASGQFPYNSTVGELFAKRNGTTYSEGTFLSCMVYCTQSYRSSVNDEVKAKALHEEMTANGFIRATKELLEASIGKKFYVFVDATTFLGSDTIKKIDQALILKSWGEQGLHWMNPRATRSGRRAHPGQYIKAKI